MWPHRRRFRRGEQLQGRRQKARIANRDHTTFGVDIKRIPSPVGDNPPRPGDHIHHHARPRVCEHHAIVPTSLERTGRCLECGAHVVMPFALSTRFALKTVSR